MPGAKFRARSDRRHTRCFGIQRIGDNPLPRWIRPPGRASPRPRCRKVPSGKLPRNICRAACIRPTTPCWPIRFGYGLARWTPGGNDGRRKTSLDSSMRGSSSWLWDLARTAGGSPVHADLLPPQPLAGGDGTLFEWIRSALASCATIFDSSTTCSGYLSISRPDLEW